MAKRKPRPDTLQDVVLGILQKRAEPLTGLQLTRLLREEGRSVLPSAVFRAVRDLVDRRAVRKIWLARAYMAASERFTIGLYCRQCGELCEVEGAETCAALDRIAVAQGFRASTFIVEVPGLCRRCARRA